jgi:hypothetical protein
MRYRWVVVIRAVSALGAVLAAGAAVWFALAALEDPHEELLFTAIVCGCAAVALAYKASD